MSNVDPETGEVLDYVDDAAVVPEFELDQWGEEALLLIQAVVIGPHCRKKRRTLLKLAEAAYLNVSQAAVFRLGDCSSKVAHYKWRKEDEAYEEAYLYLIGDALNPGLARLHREHELDEDEALAISSLVEARTRLRLASADAVRTLVDALDATDRFGALWRERIVAANSILDRADAETAARQAPAVSLVDKAIMTVYAPAHVDQQAGLPSGAPAEEANQPPAEDSIIPSSYHSDDDDTHVSDQADQQPAVSPDTALAQDEDSA